MRHGQIALLQSVLASTWRDTVARAASLCMTIRGRILVAFLVMSVITAALGIYATFGIRHAGVLVDKTFDESLMSINYARAAAADFAAMRAAFTRQWIAADPQMRAALNNQIEKLSALLAEDLQVAAGRSQSVRAARRDGSDARQHQSHDGPRGGAAPQRPGKARRCVGMLAGWRRRRGCQ